MVSDDKLNAADPEFRFRRLVILGLLIAAWLSVAPYYPEDMDFYAEALTGATYPHNLLGAVGAHFGWFMLVSIGLATYLELGLALLCSLRRLLCRKGLRQRTWEYLAAVIVFGIGCSLLLALYPNAFPGLTSALNISGLPGGVVGQLFCAPGEGWIHVLLSTVGALLISLLLILISLGVVWYYDWREWTVSGWQKLRARWAAAKAARAAAAEAAAAEAALQAPAQIDAQVSGAQAGNDGQPIYSRRGEASIAAGNARKEAIVGASKPTEPYAPVAPPPSLHQPTLPIKSPAPAAPGAPTPAPIAAAKPAPAPAPSASAASGSAMAVDSGNYQLPPLTLLSNPPPSNQLATADEIKANWAVLQSTLDEFEIDADVVNAISGPQVTLFEISLGTGVLVNKISTIANNLAMNLKAQQAVRLLLPIPGKDRAGVEVPNRVRTTVTARELFSDKKWLTTHMGIPLMLGKNINSDTVIIDLQKAPHLLIAGSTGSGKSVCINLMIQSLLLRFRPDELKLILFDPKILEFQPYSTLPHLLTPIINEPGQVGLVLQWAISEMNHRYYQLAAARVKNLDEYNHRPPETEPVLDKFGEPIPAKLPFIVIIIDEVGDIMARAQKEVDSALTILSQKSRAAGIHMIIATQRPDAKTITGVIKANFSWRIALKVTDVVNSRVILDQKGAEALLGRGDMLFKGEGDIERIQGGWVTNGEIADVVKYCSDQAPQAFDDSIERALEAKDEEDAASAAANASAGDGAEAADGDSEEDLIRKAVDVLLRTKRPTISILQRQLRIGYNKAASLMDELEDRGYVGPQPVSGFREIYWDNLPIHDAGAIGSEAEPAEDEPPAADEPSPVNEPAPASPSKGPTDGNHD